MHLADPGFAGRVELAISDARENHVELLLSNAVDYETSLETIGLARRYPEVLAAIGVHPSTATYSSDYKLDEFERLIDANEGYVKAIGEIGLDGKYTRDEKLIEDQERVFRFFLALAERRRLPVVVHSRFAVREVLATLSDFRLSCVLLHWYDGPIDNLSSFKEKGYVISIGPALFYSKSISEIAKTADIATILTETDGPVKFRGPFEGRLTQPAFVIEVARKLAEIKGLSEDFVRTAICSNFQRFLTTK